MECLDQSLPKDYHRGGYFLHRRIGGLEMKIRKIR